MDFQDHKDYSPGDDPRHINWQAYARTGNYTMKQYREEVRPTVDIILDASNSMFYDSEKQHRCAELLYLSFVNANKLGADVSCHLISGAKAILIPPQRITSQHWISEIPILEDHKTTSVPDLHRLNLRPSSIRVFISDLLYEGDPAPIIQPLIERQGRPIILIPYLNSESNPNWSGNYDFIDPEEGSKHVHRIDSATLKNYVKQYKAHFDLWIQAFQKHHFPFARVSAHKPLFKSLLDEAVPNKAFQLVQH